MFTISLHRGASVVDKFLERFGADRLGLVEQLSTNSFRAHLTDGGIALAVVSDDGQICVMETEVPA